MLIFAQFVMPIGFLIGLATGQYGSQLEWILSALVAGSFVIFIFIVGRWDWFGYPFRFILLLAMLFSVVASANNWLTIPFLPTNTEFDWVEASVRFALLCVFSFLCFKAIRGFKAPSDSIFGAFPLSGGTFYIAHGGSDATINYHFGHATQRFALDIVQLNRWGLRANGVYPKSLDKYVIFDAPVLSPVDGQVVRAVGDEPDFIPPQRDSERKAGNHVVIRPSSTDCYILIAHLRKGSLEVKEGDTIVTGQFLGRVGNSGNTTEPHLHIHCATITGDDYLTGGTGLPLILDGRFLIRNSLVRAEAEQCPRDNA